MKSSALKRRKATTIRFPPAASRRLATRSRDTTSCIADPTGRVDVKTTVQGSVGFLTETSAAVSLRVGRFDTPWWSFAPELTDYIAAPTPVEVAAACSARLYFFAGARVKARAYNAFLQGQFRHSDVRYSYDEIEPLVAEAWIGVVTQLFPNRRS